MVVETIAKEAKGMQVMLALSHSILPCMLTA